MAHSASAGLLGHLGHELLARGEVQCRILVGVFDDGSGLAEGGKRGQEVRLSTIASEFAIEALDVLASGIEPISIGRELAEEVRCGRKDGNVIRVADRPLWKRCSVLFASDVVGLFERLS